MDLVLAAPFADGPRQLAELLRQPCDGRVHAAGPVALAVGAGHQVLEGSQLHGLGA